MNPVRVAFLFLCFSALLGQTHLEVGQKAPDFELRDQDGHAVRLSQFQGKKKVVLAFYVLAFTGG